MPSAPRDLRLDFFRGVALMFIFIDHIPNDIVAHFTLQAYQFCDAAEVFIFISGFTAALVYGRALNEQGIFYSTAMIVRRAWQLYVAHVFLFMMFMAEVSYTVTTFNNPMYSEEMRAGSFLQEPHIAIVKALLLQFQPAFLDILPLYIVLLLVLPPILVGLRRHALPVLALSFLLYLAVQIFDLSVPAYPPGRNWFFNPLAWQFLFTAGAALGYRGLPVPRRQPIARILLPIAAVILAAGFVIRFSWTLHWIWSEVPPLLIKTLWPVDKNNLAPLRLASFFALVVLVAVLVAPQARFLRTRAARPLILCGRQSLEIFCLGILLSALSHIVLSEYAGTIPMQLAVTAAGVAIMFMTAKMIDWYKTVGRAPAPAPAGSGGGGG